MSITMTPDMSNTAEHTLAMTRDEALSVIEAVIGAMEGARPAIEALEPEIDAFRDTYDRDGKRWAGDSASWEVYQAFYNLLGTAYPLTTFLEDGGDRCFLAFKPPLGADESRPNTAPPQPAAITRAEALSAIRAATSAIEGVRPAVETLKPEIEAFRDDFDDSDRRWRGDLRSWEAHEALSDLYCAAYRLADVLEYESGRELYDFAPPLQVAPIERSPADPEMPAEAASE
jgi:hypothetical protein